MAFTKKTWSIAEIIPATQLNRIETGIDDAYNQDVTLAGIKVFANHILLENAEQPNAGLYIMSGSTKAAEMLTHASYLAIIRNLLGDTVQFQGTSGTADVLTDTFNGIELEAHRLRHKLGGADLLPVEPNIVVDSSGGGDYTGVRTAISAASAGDFIYVKNGTYNEGIYQNIPAGVTLYGQSRAGTIYRPQGVVMSGANARIINMTVYKNGISGAPAIDVTNAQCVIDKVKVINGDHRAVRFGASASNCKLQNSHIYHNNNASALTPVETIVGSSCNIIANNYIAAVYSNCTEVVYLNGSGHIVANNLLEAINAAGVEGVNMDVNSSYCKAVGNIIHDVVSGGIIGGQYNLVQGNIMFNAGSNFSNIGTGNIVSNNNLA